MNAQLTLRRLRPAEVEAVRRDRAWYLKDAVAVYDPLVGAFDGDKLLGYALVADRETTGYFPPGVAVIPVLDVHPTARRQGVGDYLVSELKRRYRVLMATTILHEAEPFWEREGFQEVWTDEDGYADGLWTWPNYEALGHKFAASYRDLN